MMKYAAPINQEEEWFRHTNWADKRKQVAAALSAAGVSVNALTNFQNCGSECIVEWSDEEQRYRLRANYCKNRHCEACAKSKANLLAANLKAKLDGNTTARFRFITLTLKHSTDPLLKQIKRLYKSFTKLRESKVWKATQVGGAAMLEVKYNPDNKQWHPHLHVVSQGVFLQKEELSAAWHHATGDSFIVDIRSLDHNKDVAYYVAKYVTKGTNREVWNDKAAAVEWIVATRGLRTCATYGNWRGFKLLDRPKDKGGWRPLYTLKRLVQLAHAGSITAVNLLVHLQETAQYNPSKPRRQKPG
jgi:hypothetical protein